MINATEYKLISDKLGEGYSRGQLMADRLDDMKATLDNSKFTDGDFNKRQLRKKIVETRSKLFNKHVNISSELQSFIIAFQNHVVVHYGSVNEFLEDNGILVSQDFADLSDSLGYEINSNNIE